jgi:hypothetical protein
MTWEFGLEWIFQPTVASGLIQTYFKNGLPALIRCRIGALPPGLHLLSFLRKHKIDMISITQENLARLRQLL